MRCNLFGRHEWLKLRCFWSESKNWRFFSLLWHFLPVSVSPPRQGSSASTTVHEQRSFERKAEEDDGKVSFLSTMSTAISSLCCSSFLSNDISVWEKDADQGGISQCCKVPEQMTPWGSGMWACHHGDRQNDRHIGESVAVLPSVPTPSFPPVFTTCRAPTCCGFTVLSVGLYLCARISYRVFPDVTMLWRSNTFCLKP